MVIESETYKIWTNYKVSLKSLKNKFRILFDMSIGKAPGRIFEFLQYFKENHGAKVEYMEGLEKQEEEKKREGGVKNDNSW